VSWETFAQISGLIVIGGFMVAVVAESIIKEWKK
jgi:hypothetical protein